ncbi:hypothetical protein ACHMW7_16060 [Aminobacter sp. UC22_36]|uniref:hypothetical protein n=1 Tax=Aminobacter sp. UC22_36 TaxID=3374549 RepID=UPI00375722B7
MATKPECPYCGRTTGLRQVHEGCGSIPAEYTCEGCFTATDTGPCFDDLPLAPVTMTPREAGEAAFFECEGNNAACLKAAFDAYEAQAKQAPDLLAVLKEAADFIQPFNRAADLLDRVEAAIATAKETA